MSVSLTASASRLGALAAVLLVGLFSLQACADRGGGRSPRVYLDQATAVTVTTVGWPLVFAHERPNFAVHMRDYITLAAASVDRAGKLESILIAYYWTTFDPHGQDEQTGVRPHAGGFPDELILMADDRRIQIMKLERSAHEAGIEERAHAPPVGGGMPAIYSVDLATMRYIAAARNLSAQTRTGETVLDYEMWEDGRPALAEWLHHLAE